MNAEQKQRAKDALQKWHSSNDDSPREYQSAELMAALLQELVNAPEPEPVADGHVYVHVSGLTGSGKSAVAGEIEIALRASGLDVEWVDSDSEKHLTHADYTSALELYRPKVRIFEKNISRTAPPAPSVPDGWKHDCAGILANDVELWLDSCPHCGKPRPATAPTPAESPADVARDAARWRMLPAFLEEFEISYLRLEDAIDAAIEREKMKGGEA